jgi:hypothetical protein
MGTMDSTDVDDDYRTTERREFCKSTVESAEKFQEILASLKWNWEENYV